MQSILGGIKTQHLTTLHFGGARAGFSFGPLFEIRGFYQKSLDIEANLRKLDWSITDDWADKMTQSYVDVSRYGGEMKLNLMNNGIFAPYITVGGGIQSFAYEIESTEFPLEMKDIKEEQIFGAIGIGTKFNLSDRIVLSLEAKNTFFNVNDKSYYLSPDYDVEEGDKNRLHNWSALASLDFYLGGQRSSDDAVHRAYERMFSDGFSGMKFVIEPGAAYIKLKDESLFEEQYFLGGSAGFDFSSLVGIRGFYYQATDDLGKLSLDFNNKLSMYGGNIIARLNQPRGVNPYLVLGGGYIKTKDKYVNSLGVTGDQSRGFAMGGVGLEIPLSNYIAIYGSANALLTNKDDKDVSTVEDPSQVKTSMMYQAGLRFNIGKPADADSYYKRRINRAVESERDYRNQKINELRKDYERQIKELNNELEYALDERDYAKAAVINEEKKAIEAESNLRSYEEDNYLRISPEELSKIIKDAVKETRSDMGSQINREVITIEQKPAPVVLQPQQQQQPIIIEQPVAAPQTSVAPQTSEADAQMFNQLQNNLSKQIQEINNVLSSQSVAIAELRNESSKPTTIVEEVPQLQKDTRFAKTKAPTISAVAPRKSALTFNRLDAFTGVDFGSRTYWNIGARAYWQIKDSNFDLAPEAYFAAGKKNGIGLSANLIYNLDNNRYLLNPYLGFGLGVFPGNKTVWGTNVIVGASYDTFLGTVFADYSVRSSFKQNQLAVGYRFSF